MNEDIRLSAGHHLADPGAVNSKGVKEANLTIEFKGLVVKNLKSAKNKLITDDDRETNSQYQLRLRNTKTGEIGVILDIHFNSASPSANGTETIISDNASKTSIAFATEIQEVSCKILGTRNRGILREGQTPRKRLGILNMSGIAALLEICFISNDEDMAKYHKHKEELACAVAELLIKYDNLLNHAK